ncbi:MAG: helix-turn-helix domain-containing protein [Thermodesulfobacteriota bacterium]
MELLTVRESADLLRISPHTLRAWIFGHKITFVRVGRRVLFRRGDLEKLVEEGVQPNRTEGNNDQEPDRKE